MFDDFPADSKDKSAFPWSFMVDISNPTGDVKAPVPGDIRYAHVFFAPGSVRTVIWLCNVLPDWIDEPAIRARFNVLELPEDYKWKPLRGSGDSKDPFIVDDDEEMPAIKEESKEPSAKRRKLNVERFGLECDDCLGAGCPCLRHA